MPDKLEEVGRIVNRRAALVKALFSGILVYGEALVRLELRASCQAMTARSGGCMLLLYVSYHRG